MTSQPDTATRRDRVRRYYDRNAAAFERLGQGGASIHRAVWGPGVQTREAAFHHVDDLLLDILSSVDRRADVVDLGCGLGASLLYLAEHADISGDGITLSPVQAARAGELIARAGAADRVRVREGDYLALPEDLAGQADLTFSIEAFLHSPDADGYFREAARSLRPGGRLAICDDFLASKSPPASARAARRLDEFRDGWHASSLITVSQVRTLAAAHGLTLVRDIDLTPYLELRRTRDRWISALVAAGRPLRLSGEYWQSLVGGDALQWVLLHDLVEYRFLEFERLR